MKWKRHSEGAWLAVARLTVVTAETSVIVFHALTSADEGNELM
jgi:hypothetical protein